MRIEVERASLTLPALDERRWLAFDGEAPEVLRQDLAILRAYVEALAQDVFVVSAWSGEDLLGLAIALVEQHPRDRRVLAVTHPGALHRSRCRGLWLSRGADAGEILPALLAALLAHGKAIGAPRVVVQQCPSDEPKLPSLAEALGFRALPSDADHVLHVPPGMDAAGYLEALGKKRRRNFQRDVRLMREAGAAVEQHCPIPTEIWDALWPLQLDTYARKGSLLRFGAEGLFRALARHLPAEGSVATTCKREGELLGFIVHHRAGSLSRIPYQGHVSNDGPFNIYAAMASSLTEAELARSPSAICFGYGGDAYKSRIGATAVPQISLYHPGA